ncbi:MAG: nucleotidyltransferase domain-containing protein [Candidatus Dependentiae bacterium]
MKSKTETYKKIVVPIILKHLPHAKIILYGSRARGDDRPGSDIDIALDVGKEVNSKKLNAIIMDLEESSLPIKFDLIDFYAISQEMKSEVLKDGVVWKK